MKRVAAIMPCLLALALVPAASTVAGTATVVPPRMLVTLRAKYGKNLYLPSYVPSGYRYASWSGRFGDELYRITYKRGTAMFSWGVALQTEPCDELMVGSQRVGSVTVYWGFSPPRSHNQDAWTCLRSRSGKRLLVDVFDNGGKLGLGPQVKLVASIHAA